MSERRGRRKSRPFTKGEGKYYFNVQSGNQMITISRSSKEKAMDAFQQYQRIGKNCEWLGCWNGEEFEEATAPELHAS
jgi:prephenate dehydratase